MGEEKPKTEAMNEKTKEEIRGRLLPILASLLSMGVAAMINPHIAFVIAFAAAALIWLLVTWGGPLSGKRIRYPGFGAIVLLAVVVGLCLRYGGQKSGSGNVAAPLQQVTVSSSDSPGSIPLAVGHLDVNGPVNIYPPGSTAGNPIIAQQARVPSPESKDTKQEIRSFLESLSPEILTVIDARNKEVRVWLGTVSQNELALLSKRHDFDKFLSFKTTNRTAMIGAGKDGKGTGFLKPPMERGLLTGYLLYPKDALIK